MSELNLTEFTIFAKRLQSALRRRKVTVSLPEIKASIADLVASHNNSLTESVQQECLNLLLNKYQPDTLALVEDEDAMAQSARRQAIDNSPEDTPTPNNELVKSEPTQIQQSEQPHNAMAERPPEAIGLLQINAIVTQATQQLGTEFVNANKTSIVQFVQQVTKEYATTEKLLKAVINHFQEKKANLYTELSQQIKDDSEQIRSEVDGFFREQRQENINDYQSFFNSLNIDLDVTQILSA